MKSKILAALVLTAVLALSSGCTGKGIPPIVVQTAVATGVSYSVIKYPKAVPYLRASEQVICAQAKGTNLAPAQVIATLQSSDAEALKTPEGVLILNSALMMYTAIWESYGAEAVNENALFQSYLGATCGGIGQGLGMLPPTPKMRATPLKKMYPRLSF